MEIYHPLLSHLALAPQSHRQTLVVDDFLGNAVHRGLHGVLYDLGNHKML